MDAHDDFPEYGLSIMDLDSVDEHQLSDSKKYNSGLLLKPHIQWRGKSLWHHILSGGSREPDYLWP